MWVILFSNDTGHPEHACPDSQTTEGVGLEQPVCGVASAFSNLRRSVWLRPKAAADAVQYCRNCLRVIFKFTLFPPFLYYGFIRFIRSFEVHHDSMITLTSLAFPSWYFVGGRAPALPPCYIKGKGD
jgi:hypothetical protein